MLVKPYRNQNETPQVESLSSHASFFESTLRILLGLFTSLGKQKLLFFESTVWLFLEFDRILRLYKRTNVRKVNALKWFILCARLVASYLCGWKAASFDVEISFENFY